MKKCIYYRGCFVVQSIDRTMIIAKVLLSKESGLSISDLSNECELPLSTLHRLLKAMIKHDMVQQDHETKLYSIGTIWMEYGLKTYDTINYVAKIRPELIHLMNEVEESVYLSKPVGLDALIIERIDNTNNPIRIYDSLGLRIPMNIGAANKVMLAYMPLEKSREILGSLIKKEDLSEMESVLVTIKKQGYAISHEERTDGTSSIAVPFLNRFDEVIGAVSIGFINYNLTDERIQFLIEKVVNSGINIARKMGASTY